MSMKSLKQLAPAGTRDAGRIARALTRTALPCLVGCAGALASAPDPAEAARSDSQLVLAQELGERPKPQGECPDRTEANVLENPRAPVHRTGFGLAYCYLAEGPEGGVAPHSTDTVRVHYTGWTPDGTMFDSSQDRGPTEFPLNGVIRGWTEGLQLMKPGDKARFWIPGNMGYGRLEPGEPPGSPPRGTLVFEIELLEVVGGSAP